MIASVVGLIISHTGMYVKGRLDEARHNQAESLIEYQEGVERHEEVDSGVMRYSHPDLDKSLSNWLRAE
jgi:hypothetical protein